MVIPYANCTGVITIPELALKDRPALRMGEIHWDLFKIIPRPKFSKAVSCVQFMGRSKLEITFESPTKMEDIIHCGLTIRNQPITITHSLPKNGFVFPACLTVPAGAYPEKVRCIWGLLLMEKGITQWYYHRGNSCPYGNQTADSI